MRFGWRRNGGDTALADAPQAPAAELMREIRELSAANRGGRSTEAELRIRRLRNLAGLELVSHPVPDPRFAEPSGEAPSLGAASGVPEVDLEGLDSAVLRAAILSHGCLLVRGLADPGRAERMAAEIDRSFVVRDGLAEGEGDPDGYYDEIVPDLPYAVIGRPWVADGGGVMAADSPRLLFEMLELFDAAGLPALIEGYLGEPPSISVEKCTLRRTTGDLPKAWHQDGKFLGGVRAANVWLSLSHCGVDAPGLDIVPRRLEHHAEAGLEGSIIDIEVSQSLAEELAGDRGVQRPVFEPGDALIFDDLFLHSTGSDPDMPNARYAIESWFFGPSAFPHGYVPLAL